jgi:thiamine pyrophosphokinase
MINLNNYKSILCLNGDLPGREFFAGNLPIIAADGAANQLMKIGITPQLVVGDLDSIEPSYIEILNTHLHYDQNLSDFEKALCYLKEQHLLPAVIVGVNGGYLDHVLNNINLFVNTDCVLYAPPMYGFTLHAGEEKIFNLPLNTKMSLMAMPTAQVSTQGLKWNLTDYEMSFPGNNSCFNQTINPDIKVKVNKGTIILLIYETE